MSGLAQVFAALRREPLALGFVIAGAISLGLAFYGVARAPARTRQHLGSRGLRRAQAIGNGGFFALVEPILRWGGTRVSRFVPNAVWNTLDRRITRAGDYLGLTPDEYVFMLVASTGVGALAGHGFASATGFELAPLFGAVVFVFWAESQVADRIQKRLREITHGLPYVIDLLAIGMTAGLDFPGSVRSVIDRSSDRNDALTEELERILQEIALGHTRRHALTQLAERTGAPAAQEFVHAVVQAEERGSPLADVLAIQAQVARQRRTNSAEENMARAEQAMMVPLFLLTGSTTIVLVVPVVLQVLEDLKGVF
jgi:tight adherence protein C